MKAYRGNRGVDPLILNFGTRQWEVYNTPRKELQYPLNRRLGRPQQQSRYFGN